MNVKEGMKDGEHFYCLLKEVRLSRCLGSMNGIEKILVHPPHRRTFFLFVGASLLALSLIRFLVLPIWEGRPGAGWLVPVAILLDNLTVSLFVTVAIAVLFLWISPPVREKYREIEVVSPYGQMISTLLKDSMTRASEWRYQGATGTYLRAVTLPRLAERARATATNIPLYVLIIDPREETICREYAEYRGGSRTAKSDPWSLERVRMETLATITTCVVTRVHEPNLRTQVRLANFFSRFRYDLSSDYVIVTTEDPTAPCLRADNGSYYYEQYRSELIWNFERAIPLSSLPATMRVPRIDDMTLSDVRQILDSLGFSLAVLLPEGYWAALLEKIQRPESIYG